MHCPACHSATRVLESRPAEEGAAVRRRRACQSCDNRFTTFERHEATRLFVRKRDGRREPFDRRKLRAALLAATHKRDVSPTQVDAIVDEVALGAQAGAGEVEAVAIGELCMARLRELDWGAYLQFAGTLPEPSPDFAGVAAGGSVRLDGDSS